VASRSNRFEDFFQNPNYIALKNYLYNYTLRKHAIMKSIHIDEGRTALEIGSGMSPMIVSRENVIYCDLSFSGLQILRKMLNRGSYIVADSEQLPFKEGSFSYIVCSEVLEHIEDDRKALREIARTLVLSGSLVITFPHRRLYFSCDDHFVQHFRRYELSEMESLLREAGLTTIKIGKVLGPLEKIIMISATFFIKRLRFIKPPPNNAIERSFLFSIFLLFFKWLNRLLTILAWLDAIMVPLKYATVLMIKAEKQQ
jgi:SAM-dependent methyltransferase